ncbi:hypothetical protein A2U01_0073600, partial [Trifolium medium]|nr:hypothetical protein [Trifolium medium]
SQSQQPVITPQEFQTHAVWPGDRPIFGDGVNDNAGNDNDDDIDAAAADTANDEEATQSMEGDDEDY